MTNTFFDEHFKKSNHAPRRAHDLISGEKPNSWLFDENVKKSNHAPLRAHDLISGEKPNSWPPPNPGWATAATATAEEFSQSIQAPSSTHPGISYPVRANPSLRLSQVTMTSEIPKEKPRKNDDNLNEIPADSKGNCPGKPLSN